MSDKATYRTGGHWGITIVREGTLPADERGHRADDALVAVTMNDAALAERICALLNAPQTVTVDATDLRTALDQRTGHSHSEPGRWDKDGSHCEECAARSRLREVLP